MLSDSEYELVTPEATSIIESIRSIGYNLETAISDIVDNSITARATVIKVNIYWDEKNSYIRIEDNGIGMDEDELVMAMRLGSKSPLDERDPQDLGRFGMGLKTAAFSQCRRLTVKSKKSENQFCIRCWDLDTIHRTGKWTLLKKTLSLQSSKNLNDFTIGETGTIVLLEELDRVIKMPYTNKKYDSFLARISSVEKHLSMVFHRLLAGSNSVRIYLNDQQILPWDPYLLDQDATQEILEEPFEDEEQIIKVAAYVLPHHSKISKSVYDDAEGPSGWNAQQGFYIYRNKRLLVAGSWLGLFKKEEPYKLARIVVDITSESDFNWQIDIKKSVARPPQKIMKELKRIGHLARQASYRVYYHRGTKLIGANTNSIKESHLWEQVYRHGKSFYRLNRSHPILLKLLDDFSIDERLLNIYISLVEENLPTNLIPFQPIEKVSDVKPEQYLLNEEEKEKLTKGMRDFIYAMRELKYSESEILSTLQQIEPYKHHRELISTIILDG
jgi:Histidine kinase-, DNA gyrase B-, and HSP90-like ATPase